MIAYFETSALLKVLIEEEGSEVAAATWDAVDARATSRLTYPESRAALAAARRGGRLSGPAQRTAKAQLDARFEQIDVVEVTDGLAREAGELAEFHRLRGYDAVHLASAIILGSTNLVLATWDADLIRVARSIGISVSTGSFVGSRPRAHRIGSV